MVAAWPVDTPLCALVSADARDAGAGDEGASAAFSRWSILAPVEGHPRTSGTEPRSRRPEPRPSGSGLAPDAHASAIPFLGGALGFLPYESGYAFEPTVFPPSDTRPLWSRADAALVHDNTTRHWWAVASRAAALESIESLLRSLTVAAPFDHAPHDQPFVYEGQRPSFRAGALRSDTGEAAYTSHVAAIIDHIRAGDVYQVNLAHHLLASFEGCPRALFLALIRESAPPFGALIEVWQGERRAAVLSISPELFLDADLSQSGGAEGPRRVVTRPIKGTRAIDPHTPLPPGGEDVAQRQERGALASADLLRSSKDRAELAMIVDLMRNDLGRVCEFGSVRVEDARALERHAGGSLLHTVATVAGRLRPGVALDDLLRATFPPGSVTGAPKIAAMQLIRELESRPRGAYCGAIGFASDHGPTRLSVAIRTATITGIASNPARPCEIEGELDFPVGAGIVADSNPREEWEETLAKADALRRALASADAGSPDAPEAPTTRPPVAIPPRRSAARA